MNRVCVSRGVISKSLATVCERLRFLSHSRMERLRKFAWAPVMLRWRRRANRLSNACVPRGTRQDTWTLQFHLHVASRSAELLREINVVKSLWSSIARHSERTILKHHIGGIREVASRQQVLRELLFRTAAGGKRLRNLKSAPRDLVSPISFSPQKTVRSMSGKRTPSLDQVRKLLVLGSTRIVESWRLESHSKLCEREFQIMHFRKLEQQDAISRRKNQGPASDLRFMPELAWRTAPPVQSGGIKQSEDSFTSGEQHVRSFPQHDVELQTLSPSKPAAEFQLAKLDSRVLDRLTDHVISRMERRVRIERERRGL